MAVGNETYDPDEPEPKRKKRTRGRKAAKNMQSFFFTALREGFLLFLQRGHFKKIEARVDFYIQSWREVEHDLASREQRENRAGARARHAPCRSLGI